ncbi:MAG TPA: LapA family protein [Candidatus Paceibacterota bacterium]
MIILLILGILLGGAAVVFALQNTTAITVTFFAWQLGGSLSTIIILAILSGVVASLLIVLPESVSNYFRYRKLKKENVKLEELLRKQKELTVFAKDTPPDIKTIEKIENGAIHHELLDDRSL